jgi:serine/threonine protein phosphatase 1
MSPVAIVGDVHGDFNALTKMLALLEGAERTVVFVGDYVNGGGASAAVLEELSRRKQSQAERWRFIAGNHDLALLDYVRGVGSFSALAAMGGVATLASYLPEVKGDLRTAFVSAFPARHQWFLETLAPCFEEEDLLVSHVGFCPDQPQERTFGALARSGDPRVFLSAGPRNLIVCGHYLQPSRRPFCSEHLICLDTGCGIAGGPLTAVLLPEKEFLTVPPQYCHKET